MLKVRLMGTTNDIKWFRKLLERDKRLKVLGMSEILSNKDTKKYKRMYAEIEKCKKEKPDL